MRKDPRNEQSRGNEQEQRHHKELLGSYGDLQEAALPQQRADVVVQMVAVKVDERRLHNTEDVGDSVWMQNQIRTHGPYRVKHERRFAQERLMKRS